jgi:hypothetical protein
MANWTRKDVVAAFDAAINEINGNVGTGQPKTSALGTLLEKAKSKIKVTNAS